MSDEQEPSRRGAVVTMVIIAIAIIGAIYMVNRLHQTSAIQDCVMSGRTNCAPIEAPAR